MSLGTLLKRKGDGIFQALHPVFSRNLSQLYPPCSWFDGSKWPARFFHLVSGGLVDSTSRASNSIPRSLGSARKIPISPSPIISYINNIICIYIYRYTVNIYIYIHTYIYIYMYYITPGARRFDQCLQYIREHHLNRAVFWKSSDQAGCLHIYSAVFPWVLHFKGYLVDICWYSLLAIDLLYSSSSFFFFLLLACSCLP